MSESIQLIERADGVVVLTIDQPGSRANVLNHALWNELKALFTALSQRSGVTGLVIASAKPGIFIAGADLKFFTGIQSPNDPSVREFVELGLSTLALLESLPFPTIAAIDGAALGGGLEVALACDLRVCGTHPKCELGLPEVKLGLIPGWGGSQRLPRIIDPERAAEMMASGQSLTAEASAAAGLVTSVAASETLVEFAANMVSTINHRKIRERKRGSVPGHERFSPMVPSDPTAVREVMALLLRSASRPLAEGLAMETDVFCRLVGSDTSRQMIAAFFASRKK